LAEGEALGQFCYGISCRDKTVDKNEPLEICTLSRLEQINQDIHGYDRGVYDGIVFGGSCISNRKHGDFFILFSGLRARQRCLIRFLLLPYHQGGQVQGHFRPQHDQCQARGLADHKRPHGAVDVCHGNLRGSHPFEDK